MSILTIDRLSNMSILTIHAQILDSEKPEVHPPHLTIMYPIITFCTYFHTYTLQKWTKTSPSFNPFVAHML